MAKDPRERSLASSRLAGVDQEHRREDTRRAPAPRARSAEERNPTSQGPDEPAKRSKGRPKENREIMVVSLRLPREVVEAADAIVRENWQEYRDRSEMFREIITAAVESNALQRHPAKVTQASFIEPSATLPGINKPQNKRAYFSPELLEAHLRSEELRQLVRDEKRAAELDLRSPNRSGKLRERVK